eukprot:scaffold2294_cov106-Cylindrotheca_fusiformis.AAC.13
MMNESREKTVPHQDDENDDSNLLSSNNDISRRRSLHEDVNGYARMPPVNPLINYQRNTGVQRALHDKNILECDDDARMTETRTSTLQQSEPASFNLSETSGNSSGNSRHVVTTTNSASTAFGDGGGSSSTGTSYSQNYQYSNVDDESFGLQGPSSAISTASSLSGQRRVEPGYHTIRKAFSKLPRRGGGKNKTTRKKASHSTTDFAPAAAATSPPRHQEMSSLCSMMMDNSRNMGGGSSTSSVTEGGYAGSASSNEYSGNQDDSYSPSVSSSEESRPPSDMHKAKRRRLSTQRSGTSESSSEIADFSSGSSDNDYMRFSTDDSLQSSDSPSPSTEESTRLNDLEQTYLKAKGCSVQDQTMKTDTRKRKATEPRIWSRPAIRARWPRPASLQTQSKNTIKCGLKGDETPILTVGSDIMAHVLTFLEPPQILEVLTQPFSKGWRQTFTMQPELWRVLCVLDPFKAKMSENDMESDAHSSSSDESFVSLKHEQETIDKKRLDRYRLMYTSFVRCMKYLSQIQDDAVNGRQPTFIDYGFSAHGGNSRNSDAPPKLVGTNKKLQAFFAQARGAVQEADSITHGSTFEIAQKAERKRKAKKEKKLKLGSSMITGRLLGPSQAGQPGNMNLPWSCAIYSVVNWMVAFMDVEGIQIECMKVLPYLLEDEEQRSTAQRSGLTDVVLRGMVMFNESVELHIAAFHAIVLLARPLGGREGMLFHSSMVATGIFGHQNSQNRRNGIAVMVDSMQRFEDNAVLQAMGCWALVNIALAPAQKAVLVKLGGIQATTNAMLRHPLNAEVQFRALFALINLVIPSVSLNSDSPEAIAIQEALGEVNNTSEKEMIDELAGEIAELVVNAMRNFCSSEAILNRACLVLHNLSLTQDYHRVLLWTPSCYQLLEWCLVNYRTDQVLQQSAAGTIHRLQETLSSDDDLRARFTHSLQSQQQRSLDQAHQEALRLQAQRDALLGITGQ